MFGNKKYPLKNSQVPVLYEEFERGHKNIFLLS